MSIIHINPYLFAVPAGADITYNVNVTTTFEVRITGTCTYFVEWGDGASQTVVNTATVPHTYPSAGTYAVNISVISGVFRPYYNAAASGDLITSVTTSPSYGFSGSLERAFFDAAALQSFQGDLSGVTSLYFAFLDCVSLNSLDIKDKNLSAVTSATVAFVGTGSINFDGYNLSGLVGQQWYFAASTGGGLFGWNVASRASKVTSIGTAAEPVLLGNTGSADLEFALFARNCSSLTSVCFDSGARIVNLQSAFQGCTALNSFEVLDKDLSNLTNALYAFLGTGSITFNGFNLSGLVGTQWNASGGQFGVFGSSIVSLRSGVTSIGTTSEPVILGTTSAANLEIRNFALYCASLTSVCFDSGVRITNLTSAFNGCTALNSFEVLDKNLSNVTNVFGAFIGTGSMAFNGFNLSGLVGTQWNASGGQFGVFGSSIASLRSGVTSIGTVSEPVILGTTSAANLDIRNLAYGCAGLTQSCFDTGLRITGLNAAFYLCSALTTFTILDAATVGLANITDMTNAFFGCALTAASIENILVACDTGGKTGVTLTLNGGTNAGYSTWTATAQAALASLQAKSWTVTYNA